jgi:hypothetical protein
MRSAGILPARLASITSIYCSYMHKKSKDQDQSTAKTSANQVRFQPMPIALWNSLSDNSEWLSVSVANALQTWSHFNHGRVG